MQLIVDGKFKRDRWQAINELASVPEKPSVVAYAPEVATLLDNLSASGSLETLGVSISPDVDHSILRGLVSRVGLLAIDFPDRLDGRGFSLGVLCRRWGFTGELRAVGSFIPDQYLHLKGSGFDSVSVPTDSIEKHTELEWRKAFLRFPLRYQAQAAAGNSILQRRFSSRAENTEALANPVA